MSRLIDAAVDFLRNVKYGLRNLVLFLPIVWRWRGWDFQYSYEVFMHALKLQGQHLEKYHIHEDWKVDVAAINHTLDLWERFYDNELWITGTVVQASNAEEEAWRDLHTHLREHARNWWD